MAGSDPGRPAADDLPSTVLVEVDGAPRFIRRRGLGLRLSDGPSLVEIVSAVADAVDRQVRPAGGQTDFSEMVQLAATESLAAVAGRELPRLFGTRSEDVQNTLAGLATVKQFSVLARDFFARLIPLL